MIAARDESQGTSFCNQLTTSLTELPVRTDQRPEVGVDVFGVSAAALLDSGASISAVSEKFLSTRHRRVSTWWSVMLRTKKNMLDY